MTTTTATRARSSTTQRLPVPDVLRGIAIIAMLVAHAAPFLPNVPWVVQFPTTQLNAVASPLFALVMGISAQIVWNRSTSIGTTLLQQAVRAVILIVFGVWMATWGSWVAVILAYLGVLLIVGVPLLLLRTRTVLIIAAVFLIVSQPVVAAARSSVWLMTQPPEVREVGAWILTGPSYRLINLVPFFLVGAVLLRHGFRRDRLLWGLAGLAVAAYAASWVGERLAPSASVSGDYLDTLHDIGLVFAVYVVVVLAVTTRRDGIRRFWDAVFVPIRACGQLALSLYLLHVAVIAWWNLENGRPVDNVYLGWVIIVPGMILVGWLWWRFIGTGPVEWLMGLATGRRKRWRTTRG
ncbi:acyltransferase family protein [Microbacterium oxydans]|uniref:Acyltransferase 3 domain-containing protein n=1 Tax=Microbacterium oxydans TaxID=82380 RepID=A0A0F0L846_9MICO|nr:acyltransferase family protein [Microbacterium oxydans]KJL29308.1 hypothetical protein RS83_01937 [Microbacterium oxydans]